MISTGLTPAFWKTTHRAPVSDARRCRVRLALVGACVWFAGFTPHTAAQEGQRSLPPVYFGQSPPGLTAELFAPGIVSTSENELNATFSPDRRELFFTVRREGRNALAWLRWDDGEWTRSILAFSGEYGDVDPYMTTDGRRLYFSSKRPLSGAGQEKDSDLWYVERTPEGGWGEPVRLAIAGPVGQDEYYTSLTNDGELFFSIFPEHGAGGDIFRTRSADDAWSPPERIAFDVSSESNDHDPFIAPDGSYLVFASTRPGGFGRGDLYISFSTSERGWTAPRNMGEAINSADYEFCPMLSPDGKYLFFTRTGERGGDIYWVDARIIDSLRPVDEP